MAITSRTVINTINGNVVHVLINLPPTTPVDAEAEAEAEADAVSKLVQLALGGIGVGTFSAGSAGLAYRDQLLAVAGAHGRAYEVAFFVTLAIVYLVSVGEMLAAARWVSLDGATAKKITFISFLLLLVLVAFGLVSYYLLNNH